jgi:hypothetical protein
MLTEGVGHGDLQTYPRRPDRVIPSGSIIYLAESVNSFLGELSDNTPITAIARVDLDSGRRHAMVQLIGEGWQRLRASDPQLMSINAVFRSLLFNARDIDTMGKLRQACKDERIDKIPGLGETAQIFLEVGTKKHSQVLQTGTRMRSDLVQRSS